jgi:hypothetical protein
MKYNKEDIEIEYEPFKNIARLCGRARIPAGFYAGKGNAGIRIRGFPGEFGASLINRVYIHAGLPPGNSFYLTKPFLSAKLQ